MERLEKEGYSHWSHACIEWKGWRRKAALIGHMPVYCRMEKAGEARLL
jgi:hypothetical protein